MGDILYLSSLGPRRGMIRGTRATAWYELGCATEASDPQRARSAYERALAGRPDFADAHNNLGRLLHAMHDDALARGEATTESRALLRTAEAHYRLAICGDARIALYWFNLAVSVEDQGRVAEAIAAYERALALDQMFADAHFNLARIYESIGRARNDELVLRRAVRHLVRYRDLVA